MNRIRIVPTESPLVYNVFLDDIDISKYVSSVSFYLSAQGLPEVTLHLTVRYVDLPQNISSMVNADDSAEIERLRELLSNNSGLDE